MLHQLAAWFSSKIKPSRLWTALWVLGGTLHILRLITCLSFLFIMLIMIWGVLWESAGKEREREKQWLRHWEVAGHVTKRTTALPSFITGPWPTPPTSRWLGFSGLADCAISGDRTTRSWGRVLHVFLSAWSDLGVGSRGTWWALGGPVHKERLLFTLLPTSLLPR